MINLSVMQRVCLSFFLLSFMWGSVFAGNDSTLLRKHTITINSGYITLSSIDELYSFQKYPGGNAFVGISYTYSTEKYMHQVFTSFSSIRRNPEIPSTPSYVQFYESRYKGIYTFFADLNYSVLRKVNKRNPAIYISGNLFNHFNMSSDGNPEIYFTSIGAGFYVNFPYKRHNVGFASSFPLFSFVLRNNYHTSSAQDEVSTGFEYIKENGRFCFLDKLFFINAQVTYTYVLSPRFNMGFQYGFRYISDLEPRKLKAVSGFYSVGLTYKF